MLQITSPKPVLDEKVFHNFSLFSTKHDEEIWGGAYDFIATSRKPYCAPVLASTDEASLYSGKMKNTELLTPIRALCLKRDDCFGNIGKVSDEFKNFELDGEVTTMPILRANANPKSSSYSVNIENSDSSGLFTSANYFQAFGSEPKNEITWDGIIDMAEGNSQQSSDVASHSSSKSSSLSICSSRSSSISPNEMSTAAVADGQQTNLQTRSSSKNAHCKVGTKKPYEELNNHDYCRRTQRKNQGKLSRKNRCQRPLRNSNVRTFNHQKKSYGANDMKRVVSMNKQKTQNEAAITSTKKDSQKRIPNKKITFEMFSVWLEQEMLTHKGIFFSFVTDQGVARFLQEHLILATADQLWRTFAHLKSDFVSISHDMYGNYVAQKYLELGNYQLINSVVETLKPSILSLSRGIYGCRVVQKLLECGAKEHKKVVVQKLSGSILKLVYDQNGNHVVQKMIQCLNTREIGFVADEIAGHTFRLSMHPYGSRVLQRLLDKVSWRKARLLVNEIKKHIITLSKNQYGNYIIQCIIKHYSMERREIVLKLIGHVAELSKDKYASNVIEMIFRRSSQVHLRELAEELLYDPAKNGTFPTLALLLNDQFGIYVIQTLLESSCGAFRRRLIRSLSSCGRSNKNYGGKNLVVKVGRMLWRQSKNIRK